MIIPLTVALLTYNRSHYLREAMEGILAQTYQDFEFLILDNGSTDDTPSVVLSFNDPRIRYVRNPPGFTAYFNGISAIQIARGKRIIITHDDDIMLPTMLARQMAMMDAHSGMTAVWTNTNTINQSGNTIQNFFTPPGKDRLYATGEFIARFPSENLWPLPSTMMFERAKYPQHMIDKWYYDGSSGKQQSITHGGDDVLIPAMMNTFGPVAFINDPLLKYRMHGVQDGNCTHLSLGILNTYKTLRRFAVKLPDRKNVASLIDSHIARFSAQHEVIHCSAPRLHKNTLVKLKKLFDKAEKAHRHDPMTTIPLLPLRIYLAQTGQNTQEIFDTLTPPGPEHPTAMHALFRWAKLIQAKKNLFAHLSKKTNVVILGSAFVSALLINEARAQNLNILCCIDSNTTRQGKKILGTPIHPPQWLRSQGDSVDYVILSSERDQDSYLEDFIKSINKNTRPISWKKLTLTSNSSPELN